MFTNNFHKIASLMLLFHCFFTTTVDNTLDSLYFNKPSTENFIIRWHWQFFCDHMYEEPIACEHYHTIRNQKITFHPDQVQRADAVFIRGPHKFFEEIHPHIKHPYIIVTAGDSCDRMKDEYKKYLDDEKVIAWFGVHSNDMSIQHPKFHPLPLGIAQGKLLNNEQKKLHELFRELRSSAKKQYLLYVNFNGNYGGREDLKLQFAGKPYVKETSKVGFNKYITEMAQSYFALSPRGAAIDCYRTWEALLVGTIPVVQTSCLDSLFKDLPVLIVDSWDQVDDDFLKEAYKRITSKKYDINILYAEYWTNQIREIQNRYRKV